MVACADVEPVLAGAAAAVASQQSRSRLLPLRHPLHRRQGPTLDIFQQSADEGAHSDCAAVSAVPAPSITVDAGPSFHASGRLAQRPTVQCLQVEGVQRGCNQGAPHRSTSSIGWLATTSHACAPPR